MKKNRMMRLASILLVCVLLTTSVISGTFAKYTTQDSASDMARVAKWGVELQVVGNLYGDSYDDKIVLEGDTNVAVQSLNKADDVVAPGTKNDEGFAFTLEGQPEVDGVVTTEIKYQSVFLKAGYYGRMVPVSDAAVNADNFDELGELYYFDYQNANAYVKATAYDANFHYFTLEDYTDYVDLYYPVEYKLTGATSDELVGYTTNDSFARIAGKIAEQFDAEISTDGKYTEDFDKAITVYTGTKNFETNENLNNWAIVDEKLTWNWTFCRDTENCKSGDGACRFCKADTILGLLVDPATKGNVVKLDGDVYVAPVEYTDYCVESMFSLDITVTQVD